MPTWLDWRFLVIHALVCAGVAAEVLLISRPWNAVVAGTTAIVIHEWTKVSPSGKYLSDFQPGAPGAPLNGALDVISGTVGTLIFITIWSVIHAS